jgi:hypothetical protein
VQILFLEPEANTGVMCIVIAEKEIGTAMQLLSNTVPFCFLILCNKPNQELPGGM